MEDQACDVADRTYDPFSHRLHTDPYPTYAWLREHAPLYRNEERNFWALSRYDDVAAALRDPGRFSSRNGISLEPDLWGPDAARTSFFLAMDPPEHRALRQLLGERFKPRWVAAMEPQVRAAVRARLVPALAEPVVDFAALAASVPNDIMCDLVGIASADRDRIRADNDLLNHCEDSTDHRSAQTIAAGFRLALHYVQLVNDRRRRPRDDLTSHMLDARVDGRPLTDSELVAFLFLLVSATNESTGKQIGLALYHGAQFPAVAASGLTGRAAAWAQESLRYDSASQMMARTLTKPTTLHGTPLPAGSRVALLPAAANRDPDVFADPDCFDLDRDTSRSLSFGHGPHFCLGSALAQLEITVTLEEIGAAVERYELDLDHAQWIHSPHQRGFTALPGTVVRRPTRP
jgi:cytochrome P450